MWIGEVHTGVWWGNLRLKDHLEDLGVDGRITFRKDTMKTCGSGGIDPHILNFGIV
jgi:hypothetical protein